ncbi:hypothetical protein LV779_26085 [Streptomyces thinghirensis]|nr:hypothetical protein [Streptomyces thinghirensis]
MALSVGSGVAAMLCALTVAVLDWRRDRSESAGRCPPETTHSHTHAGQG